MQEPDNWESSVQAGSTPPLESILETAHEAFISIDEDGRIRAWNREAERTFGWAREMVIGERLQDVVIPPQYRARHEQ